METRNHWLMKRYRVFIHKVHLESHLNIKTISMTAGRSAEIAANVTYEINQEVEICSIGRGRNANDLQDQEVCYKIYLGLCSSQCARRRGLKDIGDSWVRLQN